MSLTAPLSLDDALKQIAKRCILGFHSDVFQAETPASQLAKLNPLGYIFFRASLEACPSLEDLKLLLQNLQARHDTPLVLGLDQEGGQVERLPSRLLGGGLSPFTVGEVERLAPDSRFAERYYRWQSQGIQEAGFNLNFFPTLDVHLHPQNPIIGNRAFSTFPAEVQRLGRIAMQAQSQYGIQSVLKHFPGHGNGTVDSHLALPQLQYSEAEVSGFFRLMHESPNHHAPYHAPWVMLAHGIYPDLQTSSSLPASCDKAIVQGFLREQHGFNGIAITDDLNMRGILDAFEGNQVDACLTALNAGVDVLLFRESGARELEIITVLAKALLAGDLDVSLHRASLERLQHYTEWQVASQSDVVQAEFSLEAWQAERKALHQEAVSCLLTPYASTIHSDSLVVLEPNAIHLPHYVMESQDESLLKDKLKPLIRHCLYDESERSALDAILDTLSQGDETSWLVVVWLPHVGEKILEGLRLLRREKHTVWVVNIGVPQEASKFEEIDFHLLNLGTWRPLTISSFFTPC
jgi:beta-glucosidase-like glycosyl hydrolase